MLRTKRICTGVSRSQPTELLSGARWRKRARIFGVVSVRRRRAFIAACLAGLVVAGGLALLLSTRRGVSRGGAGVPSRGVGASRGGVGASRGGVPHLGSVALALGYSGTPFGESFWGQRLPASTPINPNSATYVDEIEMDLANGPHASREGFLPTISSPPLYVVPANQPYVHVDTWIILPGQTTGQISSVSWLQRLKTDVLAAGVPIPAQALPAQNTPDRTIDIYQPSTNRLWELWHVGKDADGNWAVQAAGLIDDVSHSDGIFPAHEGTAATENSLVGVVSRIEELQAGRIDHPVDLELAASSVLKRRIVPANTPGATNSYSWPATNNDGNCINPNCIPEGLRFRLDPKLNLASLHLSPVAQTIAIAAQNYGFVVMNSGHDTGIKLGNPQPYIAAGLPNPYMKLFGSAYGAGYSAKVMANFPWHALQALPYDYGMPGGQ